MHKPLFRILIAALVCSWALVSAPTGAYAAQGCRSVAFGIWAASWSKVYSACAPARCAAAVIIRFEKPAPPRPYCNAARATSSEASICNSSVAIRASRTPAMRSRENPQARPRTQTSSTMTSRQTKQGRANSFVSARPI